MKSFKELLEEIGTGKYMHCNISLLTNKTWHKNQDSGHEWSTETPQTSKYGSPTYQVTGGKLGQRNFKTIDTAKKAIEFDHEVQFGKFANLKPSMD